MVEEYPIDEEEKAEEDIESQYERQQEVYDDNDTMPTSTEKDDLYSLFWRVVKTPNSSKVGNLDPKTELGVLDLSVRDCQRIALIGATFGHKGFAKFFFAIGEIILATSASKKGWLPELFVSQKKLTAKMKGTFQSNEQKQQKKGGLFKRWRTQEE